MEGGGRLDLGLDSSHADLNDGRHFGELYPIKLSSTRVELESSRKSDDLSVTTRQKVIEQRSSFCRQCQKVIKFLQLIPNHVPGHFRVFAINTLEMLGIHKLTT